MHKVNVIYDIEPEYLFDNTNDEHEVKLSKNKGKNVKISDKIFDHMLSEGLIKKTNDGYVFVGKYEDIKKLEPPETKTSEVKKDVKKPKTKESKTKKEKLLEELEDLFSKGMINEPAYQKTKERLLEQI